MKIQDFHQTNSYELTNLCVDTFKTHAISGNQQTRRGSKAAETSDKNYVVSVRFRVLEEDRDIDRKNRQTDATNTLALLAEGRSDRESNALGWQDSISKNSFRITTLSLRKTFSRIVITYLTFKSYLSVTYEKDT
ncbi:hypothetical protein LXL04_004960 [Taraxacum kok-saghyz]